MLYATQNELLTREQLREIPVPERTNVSSRWEGIAHGQLADTLVERIQLRGLKVKREVWKTNPQQSDLFGALDIVEEAPSRRAKRKQENLLALPELDLVEDAVFSIGVRHSNLGRYAVSLAVGARIAVCENGLFTGDFVLKAKHTSEVDLEGMIDIGIEKYVEEAAGIKTFVEELRDRDLASTQADHLLMEMGRVDAIPWTKIQDVDKEWREPRFEEFQDRNAWSLYNAATYVIRDMSGSNQMRCLKNLKDFFSKN